MYEGDSGKNVSSFLAFFSRSSWGNESLGDTRKGFVFGEKRLPPSLRVVVPEDLFVLCKKNASPFCFVLTVCFGKQVVATQSDMR